MIRRLALAVGAAALLAVPATAAAAHEGRSPRRRRRKSPKATVKVEPTGLAGGKATILDTVTAKGTVSPYVAGQYVEVTFYLQRQEGHQPPPVAVQQGPNETGTFESDVIVKDAGKYAVSAKHVATATLGGDSTVRKSWTVTFPKLNPGECTAVVGAFKTAPGEDGLRLRQRRVLHRAARPRGPRLPQGQRHGPHQKGRRRAWSRRSSQARAATT